MYKLDLEKAEEPEIKFPTSARSWKKQENSIKTSTSASLTALTLIVWVTTKYGKLFKEMGISASCKTCMQVKRQQLELDMEQRIGSKLGKEYGKARLYIVTWLI